MAEKKKSGEPKSSAIPYGGGVVPPDKAQAMGMDPIEAQKRVAGVK